MPNIESAKKRAKQSEVRRQRNMARKSDVKTAIRKVLDAVENKDMDQAKELLSVAQAKLARAKGKGLYHINTVARKMSQLAKKVKSIEAA
jgi:small subunit ribosomal protein S20